MGSVIIASVVALVVGIVAGLVARRAIAARNLETAEARAARVMADAEREAETKVRQALVEVKEEIAGMRREAEESLRARQEESQRLEDRLSRQEEAARGHEQALEARQRDLDAREQELHKLDAKLGTIRAELERVAERHRSELEKISRMTTHEAKEALVAQVVDEAKRDAMAQVRELEQRAREEGEKRARKIVTIAIQRVATDQTSESTVSVFPLPSEDMKGRIIGREGRNIRAFEAKTGVNLIIDDTPEAVVLSSFDPVRREIARLTLEKLVSDGRIHPARIEEMYERSLRRGGRADPPGGRGGPHRRRHHRRPPRDGEGPRQAAVPDLVRAEHPPAPDRGRSHRRGHRRRARHRSGGGQARGAPARHRQGRHPRGRGVPRPDRSRARPAAGGVPGGGAHRTRSPKPAASAR